MNDYFRTNSEVPMSHDISKETTEALVRKPRAQQALCEFDKCPYDEQGFKRWVENKISETKEKQSTLWFKILAPLLAVTIAIFGWARNLEGRVQVVEIKQSEITEIKTDLKSIQEELVRLRIELTRLQGQTP